MHSYIATLQKTRKSILDSFNRMAETERILREIVEKRCEGIANWHNQITQARNAIIHRTKDLQLLRERAHQFRNVCLNLKRVQIPEIRHPAFSPTGPKAPFGVALEDNDLRPRPIEIHVILLVSPSEGSSADGESDPPRKPIGF